MERVMAKRLLMAFGSFWIAGLVAILVMSDSGTMSNLMALTGIPLLATVGLLVGPITFVVGLWGLTHGGYGCDGPTYLWPWIVLAYLGYLLLFLGAILPKSRMLRCMCLAIEAACALVAAKGVAYCI